jgi:hypothetical protein
MAFHSNPAAAAITRACVQDTACTERYLVGETYLHSPGFEHLARSSGAYRLAPEPWVLES